MRLLEQSLVVILAFSQRAFGLLEPVALRDGLPVQTLKAELQVRKLSARRVRIREAAFESSISPISAANLSSNSARDIG